MLEFNKRTEFVITWLKYKKCGFLTILLLLHTNIDIYNQALFLAIFANNVNFYGKLENFSGILFSQNGGVKYTHLWNRIEL